MRVVGEIPHPDCKITIFSWNNRYLIKFESGLFEQTFKVAEYDILQESDLYTLVDEAFIQDTLARFDAMNTSFRTRLQAIS